MFNNTLRSFSLGMIIATSFITAVYLLQPKSLENDMAMTESQIEQYLNEKEYVAIPKAEYIELLAQKGANPELKEEKIKQETTDTQEKEKEEQATYTLIIESGMSTKEIADLLEQSGIIEDSNTFVQFLEEKNWSRSIQIGSYDLNRSMSYEEIGKIITKKLTSP